MAMLDTSGLRSLSPAQPLQPLDLWTVERNTYAKEVMLDIKAQRREAAR